MDTKRKNRFSLVSRGAWGQFWLAVALITIIPLLSFLQLMVSETWKGLPGVEVYRIVFFAATLTLCVLGYLIFSKYPRTIVRLRRYLESIVNGVLPEKINLVRTEDDIFAIEESFNLVLGQLRRKVEIVESEKIELEKQLIQTQKLEAIAVLVSGVAHDFNNMLTAVSGYAHLLLNELSASDERREDVQEILRVCNRAASLIHQLLAFGRKQILKTEIIELKEVINRMEDMIRRLLGENVQLVVELDLERNSIKADPSQMEQVIMNMLLNARDAMPHGGNIILKTAKVALKKEGLEERPEARPGSYIELFVKDAGEGMDEETIQRIFDPFFSTKKAGNGLGLSVVHGIVKQHEGWIEVSSKPEEGSEFRVYLPVYLAEKEEETRAKIPAMEIGTSRGERILVVEDDEEVRRFARKALSRNGYKVFEALDAEKARELFNQEQGRFHIVFTDQILPDGKGVDLVEKFLSRNPELGVILTSGYMDEKTHWDIVQEKGYRFLKKPYTLPELLQAIDGELRKRTDTGPAGSFAEERKV